MFQLCLRKGKRELKKEKYIFFYKHVYEKYQVIKSKKGKRGQQVERRKVSNNSLNRDNGIYS